MNNSSILKNHNSLSHNKEGLQRQVFRQDLRRYILVLFNPGDVLDLDDIVAILYSRHGLIFKKQDIKDGLSYLLRTKKIKKLDDNIYGMLAPQKKKRMMLRDERETK